MNFDGFIGGSYSGRTLAADGERSKNLYPEKIESPGGAQKAEHILLSKPGLAAFANLTGATSVQAEIEANGRGFAVAGGKFWEVFSNGGSATSYGQVGSGRIQLCASQSQILITGGAGFIFNLASNTLTQITASGWIPTVTKLAFIDGYFIALEANSQLFIISGINDGLSWNLLDFGDAEGEQGNIVTLIADHRQLWLLGNTHSEIYYNSGDANFPFKRLEGAFSEQGCGAIDSVAKVDNTIFWLGGNRDGAGIVWRAAGYTPQRISTHAIEALIQSYGDISGATGYCYQEGGHTFYRLDFGTATLVYDVASGFWHERTYLVNGIEQADLARTHMYVFGKHLVGDYQSGTIYEQSMKYVTDNGAPIRRERTAPDLSRGGLFTFYSELRLLMQTGMGLDGTGQGTDPQITLQISDDGGFTWGLERTISCGKLGAYKMLVRWRRLGRSQNRAFRVVITEPIFVAFIAADLDRH